MKGTRFVRAIIAAAALFCITLVLSALIVGAAEGTDARGPATNPEIAFADTLTETLSLPLILNGWCPPRIELTSIPPLGSYDDLYGRVACVQPADYRVAVYIYVSGWWTKPTFANPLTPIAGDGSWSTDITTGGSDQLATRIAAFLLPGGYDPPPMSGGQTLPAALFDQAAAYAMENRGPVSRAIAFSGYTWQVKASDAPVGPGPNYFSDREQDVWVDASGRLHLKIVYRDGTWHATEVYTVDPLGYGTYTFKLASRVDQLDKNIILGLFTWDSDAPAYNYREIDIEIARWGQEAADNAQFVVQPWDHAGNLYRFDIDLQGDDSTHSFDWRADSVQFRSYHGHTSPPAPADEIASWLYTGPDVPPAGQGDTSGASARINLWLMDGNPPSDGQEAEVIVAAFEFIAQD
jgi:hypothetical protein